MYAHLSRRKIVIHSFGRSMEDLRTANCLQRSLAGLYVVAFVISLFSVRASAQIVAPRAQGASSTSASNNTNGIEYHGGPIIANPHVYFIWYGNWTGNTALTILPQFISGLSLSPYFNINSTYSDNTGAGITSSVAMN